MVEMISFDYIKQMAERGATIGDLIRLHNSLELRKEEMQEENYRLKHYGEKE